MTGNITDWWMDVGLRNTMSTQCTDLKCMWNTNTSNFHGQLWLDLPLPTSADRTSQKSISYDKTNSNVSFTPNLWAIRMAIDFETDKVGVVQTYNQTRLSIPWCHKDLCRMLMC